MGDATTDILVTQVDFDGDIIDSVIVAQALASMGKALYVIGAPESTPFDARSDATFEVSASEPLGITALRGTPPGAPAGYLWENAATPLSNASIHPVEGEYFVSSQNGNDSWEGSFNRPWRTLQHAADTVGPGETATIMAGTHNKRLIPQNSGSAGQIITYRAYPGDRVTLDGTGISLSDEDIDGFRGEQDEETRGSDFVEDNPLFVDRAAFDFHLMSGSPAVDAGSPNEAPPVDFDGIARPQGSGIDIGAFER